MPLIAVVAASAVLLLIALYTGTYVTQSALISQYDDHFIIEQCPTCHTGHLHLEERRYSVLGIPRARRVVRCDTCHSVLRQVGRQRWRYAVDQRANPTLYERLNGRALTEQQILELSQQEQDVPPEYIEGDRL